MTGALLAAFGAAADDVRGFYTGLNAGVNFQSDSDFEIGGGVGVDNEYDAGFAISGVAGYDYGQAFGFAGVRGELELAYRENEIDVHTVDALGGDQPGSEGESSSLALMANGYLDFNEIGRFTPYVGAGIGFAQVSFEDYGIQAAPDVLDDEDTGFAWQLMVGTSVDVSETTALVLDYRFLRADVDLTSSAATGSVDSDVDYQTQTLSVGVRYKF